MIQLFAELRADFRWNTTSPSIRNISSRIDRAEVPADCDVIRTEFEVDPECFQNTSTNLIFYGIVAKQTQVTRATSGSDSRQHGGTQSQCSSTGEGVKIRSVRRFKFCLATGFERQASQSVANNEHNLGAVIFLQFPGHLMRIGHESFSLSRFRGPIEMFLLRNVRGGDCQLERFQLQCGVPPASNGIV